MASSSDKPELNSGLQPRPASSDRHSERTAKDLVVPLPEYLKEIHAVLQRTEQAYARGDLAECARSAEEGLLILRLPLPKLSKTTVPPHYELFFRCFRHQDAYRTALALYKQGLLLREVAQALPVWQRAWDLMKEHFADVDEQRAASVTYDFPVAGRVLRGVVRLRERLLEVLQGP